MDCGRLRRRSFFACSRENARLAVVQALPAHASDSDAAEAHEGMVYGGQASDGQERSLEVDFDCNRRC